ncbi:MULTISPECIES: penicillin acylase family protein [unclassified Robiginitalea]|uniref:penicillin acylase family protein n=1 Tax=Robiginitalea TaxID=252306 RepID=UPI002349ECB5|nr:MULTISPECIES: penicillin acylase family protein [unclassified Robiginitalea]MDC6353420.1 penicillin acylase family protein [Robiginitalea sp. PM2]MDC6373415.1 penicillin acylase family protein [Robiginitalea sp. SP8]
MEKLPNSPRLAYRRLLKALQPVVGAVLLMATLTACRQEREAGPIISGIQEDVEVVRDPYGINHIYAKNEHDLFFAQGYLAARDRLFQFEIWRRQATGTVAEILGERELQRDIGTRLFAYRGDLEEDFGVYHPRGSAIIRAYTDGVNAYIDEALADPESLPLEFRALGILPGKWTPDVVISRHQGLLGNSDEELAIGRAVAAIGEEAVKSLLWFHPKEPDLQLADGIDAASLSEDILKLYNAYRKPVRFEPEDLDPGFPGSSMAFGSSGEHLNGSDPVAEPVGLELPVSDSLSIGSNNWVVAGERTASGLPVMANDPHRRISVPSLRYMVHLVAPGWDVIGGGEPEIPGVSIGHNPHGAWGLTVFRTDGEDIYVYDTDPENPDRYRYREGWEEMETIRESIPVKGREAEDVTLKYTRHGPVLFQDTLRNKAYAMRCAWLEPGGAPYLASLRMDQARTWEEFREACNYSHIPGENMVWADTAGNIGWQAVGIAPIRPNFSGLVPVPGDGSHEWDGYLPIVEKPHALNPDKDFIATANQNVTPPEYDRWDAVGYSWSDPFRGDRIEEVLGREKPLDLKEMQALQTDYLSFPARELTPYLQGLELSGRAAEAREQLSGWDYRLEPESVAAAIYVAWENRIREAAHEQFVPEAAKPHIGSLQLERILQWVREPGPRFGGPTGRNAFLREAFELAVEGLEQRLGADMSQWQYGQPKMKHIRIRHPLSGLLPDRRESLDLGPLSRGGNGYTPGSTGNNMNQSSGATFRLVVPVGDWDRARAMNSPGQSGDPDSPYYGNLFEAWARDQYFPLYYSRDSILKHADARMVLQPE